MMSLKKKLPIFILGVIIIAVLLLFIPEPYQEPIGASLSIGLGLVLGLMGDKHV